VRPTAAGVAAAIALLGAPPGAPARAQAPLVGEWSLRPTTADAPAVGAPTLFLVLRAPGLNTLHVPLGRLEGLTAAQLAAADTRVRFRLREDAGTLEFEGDFRRGRGMGWFEFVPDPAFAAALQRRGMERPTPTQQLSLARHGVGLALLDELAAQGYARPTTEALVGAALDGPDLDELRELGALGVRLGTLEALTRRRSADGMPALRALGRAPDSAGRHRASPARPSPRGSSRTPGRSSSAAPSAAAAGRASSASAPTASSSRRCARSASRGPTGPATTT
jgi:hypothetical protein